jgi:hypothetical protein
MVSFNTVLASAAALSSTLPLVLGAATLPRPQDSDSSISRRQSSWDEYHQLNGLFAEQGLCRYYLDPTSRDGLWPCRQYCGELASATNYLTCNGNSNNDPSTISTNPDGERWTPGECWCENPVLEVIVDFTALGLQELPGITCAVWLQAAKESVKLGSYAIPGVGPAAKAAEWMIKSVKAADLIGGKERWNDWITKTCGLDEQWEFDLMGSAFDIFQQAPGEAST